MPGSFDYRHLLATYLRPESRGMAALVVLLAAAIGLQLIGPGILRQFIDDAAAGAPLASLAVVAVLFLAAALALQLVLLVESYVAENVSLSATNRLRADITLHVLHLDPPFHAAHTPGELIERTDGDVGTLGTFFSRLVVQLVGNGLFLICAIALLAAVDWRMGAVTGGFAAAAVALVFGLRRISIPRYAAQRQANADLFGLVEERLTGAEDVRANGGVTYSVNRLLERSRHLIWTAAGAQVVGGGTFNGVQLCLHFGTLGALAIAAYLYRAGELSIGTVYLVYAYAESLRRPLEDIGRHVRELQQAAASIGRIRGILTQSSAVGDSAGPTRTSADAEALLSGPLEVDFTRVTFAYGTAEPALRDVSFHLGAGKVLGLLGRTGSGKTTIARLLFRLYDPTSGAISLNRVDLRDVPLDLLRSRIALVTQDVQLFHASVRDNITLFEVAIPDDSVLRVVEEVGLSDWLAIQPEGLNTILPPGGGLSAGEAQLLAFARVFLHDPGLIVLDEASSRLDPATERLLERAVDRLLAGRTAIVIAHRLETVRRADRILILEGGQIVEDGDRIALADDPTSRFSELLRVGIEADQVLA